MQLEPLMDHTKAETELKDVTSRLHLWETHKNTDSKTIDRLRLQDLRTAQISLEKLHYHLDPALGINITTGQAEIQGSSFRKDTYDFYQERFRTLKPGSLIPFTRIEVMHWEDQRNPTFYVGSFAVMLSLPTLAETLFAGGQLALVQAEELASAPSLSE